MEANISFKDDFRLAMVVMKNEFLKQKRGKRLYIYGALLLLIIVSLTGALLATGGLGDNPDSLSYMFVSMVTLMMIVGATLFGATTIVSEFEERTALIIFNRPINKWSIYLGKFMSAYLILIGFFAVYYIFIAILCLVGTGQMAEGLLASFGYALAYAFAATGIALMISSFMKKASTASILTFFTIFMLLDIVFGLISMAAGIEDTWYMLNTAGSAVTYALDPTMSIDGLKTVGTLLVWGLVPGIIGFLKFRNRDF